jgi:hypothetical protein
LEGLGVGKQLNKILLLLLLTLSAGNTIACRYNVRETGFIYLAQKPYQLTIYYSDNTPMPDIELIKALSSDFFNESNIETGFVNINSKSKSNILSPEELTALPTALLKSPDGQIKELALFDKNESLEESAKTAFSKIISSKKRDEIIDKCISNYGVILLFEGKNNEANKKAVKEAQAAIEHIKSKMSLLPKKISKPPTLVIIKNDEIGNEKVLVWSLGLENRSFSSPMTATIYGRGRWIGPILEGEQISKRNLSELLLIIGADCECGIDRDWMRGTMIPSKWDKATREKVTENLEFDPENPLIKKEVRHILRMGEIYANIPQNDTNHSPNDNTTSTEPSDKKEKIILQNNTLKHLFIKIGIAAILVLIIGLFISSKMRNRV